MKILFFTKPKELTFLCLQFLHSNQNNHIQVILSDKKQYEGSEFYQFCLCNNITVYDEKEIYEPDEDKLKGIDLIISCIFPHKIAERLLQASKNGGINFHPAPLPEYRGVFAYNFAILNEEMEFGVTVHELSDTFDRGDIIEVLRFAYDCKNGMLKELVEISDQYLYQLFVKTICKFYSHDTIEKTKQSEGHYYSRKDFEEAKKITECDTTDTIRKKIRAFWYPPYEGAFIELNGVRYTLAESEQLKEAGKK